MYKKPIFLSKLVNIIVFTTLNLSLIGCFCFKKPFIVGGPCDYEKFQVNVLYTGEIIFSGNYLIFKEAFGNDVYNLDKDFLKKQLPQIDLKQLTSDNWFTLKGEKIVKGGGCIPIRFFDIKEYKTR